MQKCTPTGYQLRVWSDMIRLSGSLMIAFTIFEMLWRNQFFYSWQIRILLVAAGLILISEILYRPSLRMAAGKAFQYDTETGEASWMDAGERMTFKHDS